MSGRLWAARAQHTVKVGELSSFLIIVAVFTCYIGTAPELESVDRCRAHGLGGFSSLTLRQANLPKPVLVTLDGSIA